MEVLYIPELEGGDADLAWGQSPIEAAMKYMGSATIGRAASMRPPRRSHRERPTGVEQPISLPEQ